MAMETARRSTILLVDDDPSTLLLASNHCRITDIPYSGSQEAKRFQAIRGTPNTHPSRRHRHLPPTPGLPTLR